MGPLQSRGTQSLAPASTTLPAPSGHRIEHTHRVPPLAKTSGCRQSRHHRASPLAAPGKPEWISHGTQRLPPVSPPSTDCKLSSIILGPMRTMVAIVHLLEARLHMFGELRMGPSLLLGATPPSNPCRRCEPGQSVAFPWLSSPQCNMHLQEPSEILTRAHSLLPARTSLLTRCGCMG